MSVANNNSIPVTVISGFLGAGKTTYLNRLIAEGRLPSDSFILVNDFGGINIDAELIEFQDERIIKLSNGCICCTLGGTLAEQLADVLRMPDPVAAIYIEASGVSDPARIADIAKVSRKLKLGDIVCVLDASQQKKNSSDPRVADIWHDQIRSANKILLNRATPDDEEVLRKKLPPSVEVIIDDTPRPRNSNERRLTRNDGSLPPPLTDTTKLVTFSLILNRPVDKDWLDQLFEQYQDTLVRAKGIVYTISNRNAQVVQLSGNLISWCPTAKAPPKGQLVFIGADNARFSQLKALLAAH